MFLDIKNHDNIKRIIKINTKNNNISNTTSITYLFHLLVFLFIFLISARVQLSSQSEQAFTQKIVTLNMHQGRLIGHLRYTF